MHAHEHAYAVRTQWDSAAGTESYRSYSRIHTATAAGPGELTVSADRTFHGDREHWNPELLLVSALSSCHMLSFLAEAARAGVTVLSYTDEATGTMRTRPEGSGEFEEVTLRPRVRCAEPTDPEVLEDLHRRAHEVCFIARSVNFPVRVHPDHTDYTDATEGTAE